MFNAEKNCGFCILLCEANFLESKTWNLNSAPQNVKNRLEVPNFHNVVTKTNIDYLDYKALSSFPFMSLSIVICRRFGNMKISKLIVF